ncbi:hypothetical protein [Mesobacterium pallidum]|uniref:hypothetical protein n=1 Tax=Mesobacterium pallidum TaxID=2872037 RepID=UPI001EE231AE|nr:hypothetical protein [Mesobacterium pallidum]
MALELAGETTSPPPKEIAKQFQNACVNIVRPLLDRLGAFGQATVLDDGRYTA